jgi:probable HAF family extracellular repeat protein
VGLWAINAAGQVIGYAGDSSGYDHAFLYSGGASINIEPAGEVSSRPYAINAAGEVIGVDIDSSGHYHSFLYSGGTSFNLDP